MKLTVGTRKTTAYYLLNDGLEFDGASVTRRRGGYTDFDVIKNLMRLGWMECRQTGPRGGSRYYTTELGREQLEQLLETTK